MLEIIDLKAYREEEARRLNSTEETQGIKDIENWRGELEFEAKAFTVMDKVIILALMGIDYIVLWSLKG